MKKTARLIAMLAAGWVVRVSKGREFVRANLQRIRSDEWGIVMIVLLFRLNAQREQF